MLFPHPCSVGSGLPLGAGKSRDDGGARTGRQAVRGGDWGPRVPGLSPPPSDSLSWSSCCDAGMSTPADTSSSEGFGLPPGSQGADTDQGPHQGRS